MWARYDLTLQAITATSLAVFDLLAFLRNPSIIPTRMIQGQNQLATVPGAFPTQDFTGATILRTHIELLAWGDGSIPAMFLGAKIEPLTGLSSSAGGLAIATDFPKLDPANGPAAQTEDWYMWQPWLPATIKSAPADTVGTGIQSMLTLDVRSKRRIQDWGDTAALLVAPDGDLDNIRVIASTLLAMP